MKAVEDISNLPASNTKSGVLGEQSVTPTATPQANFVDDISNRPTPRHCVAPTSREDVDQRPSYSGGRSKKARGDELEEVNERLSEKDPFPGLVQPKLDSGKPVTGRTKKQHRKENKEKRREGKGREEKRQDEMR